MLAQYIIKAAHAGERDARWLADSALVYLIAAEIKPDAAERLRLFVRGWYCRCPTLLGRGESGRGDVEVMFAKGALSEL
jgi:hypothetical protein